MTTVTRVWLRVGNGGENCYQGVVRFLGKGVITVTRVWLGLGMGVTTGTKLWLGSVTIGCQGFLGWATVISMV